MRLVLCPVLLLSLACAKNGASPAPDAGMAPATDAETLPPDGGVEVGEDAGTEEADATQPPDASTPLRVLFVGNSYTYFNDLPAVVRALGNATPGAAVEVESITEGGARLQDHWATTGAKDRIAMSGLDAVVLQGQSVEPISDPKSFYYHAELFAGALDEAGAKGVWFATWARRIGDPIYENGFWTPENMTEALEFPYRHTTYLHGGFLARVGAAWLIAIAELPEVVLFTDDGSHPTEAGTLLSACVILQAITGLAPIVPDPPPLGLSLETANALCAIAPRVICPEDQNFCEGRCVDLMSDPLHCSACNAACAADDPCREGQCGCDEGLTGCNRLCYDTTNAIEHCGTCDTRCIDGQICDASMCVCPGASAQLLDFGALSAIDPGCASWIDAGSAACSIATHRYCETFGGCFNSGIGPPTGHAPRPEEVICVAGDVRATTYTEMQTFVPACDGVNERLGQNCSTAFSRYCASLGAVSGFGPVESAGDNLTVTCVSSATVAQTTFDELYGFASRCAGDLVDCQVAAWNFCQSRGHVGGFGPLEVLGNNADVVCLTE